MLISRKSDYALRALVYIAGKPENTCSSIREIAEHEDIPREFAAKILKGLTIAGFLRSQKGVHGGYSLVKNPEEITLYHVISALEGPLGFNLCVSEDDSKDCERSDFCLMRGFWSELQEGVVKALKNQTITPFVQKNGRS